MKTFTIHTIGHATLIFVLLSFPTWGASLKIETGSENLKKKYPNFPKNAVNISIRHSVACPTVAPVLTIGSISNTCPIATVDVSGITATNTPSGSILTWHTSSTATSANQISNITAINTAGTYYVAFYEAANNCYSDVATTPVTVTINSCVPSSGSIDCIKTQLRSAPSAGTPSQHVLVLAINVSQAGFFPININGSGMNLANNLTGITALTTGVQTFYLPLEYDGTALATLNFSVAGVGGCSADLTQPAKQVINDVWTLACSAIPGPSLK